MATRLLGVSLNTADLARASDFYCQALGFATVPAFSREALFAAHGYEVRAHSLRLGAQRIELVAFDPPGAPMPPDSTAADLWSQHFAIVVDDIAGAAAAVERHGAIAITRDGPQLLPKSSGGVTAYKFRDPEGHPLELIHFPDRRDAPGIDQSAISVADASRSLAFYRALGLQLRTRQLNQGPEQDRLDGLSSVNVDVIGLFADMAPPHLELLCYRKPRGRPRAAREGLRAIDDSRLLFEVDDIDLPLAALEALGTTPAHRVEPGLRAAAMRDPDGHAIVITERR
jgi:catechol 2,3-dioxygenase-like lactoylglutathione lyase family enzyme